MQRKLIVVIPFPYNPMLSTCFKWMHERGHWLDDQSFQTGQVDILFPDLNHMYIILSPPIYFIGRFKLWNINNNLKAKILKQFFNLFVFLLLGWKSLKLLNGLKQKVAKFDLFKSLIPAGADPCGTSFRCNFSNPATSSLPVKYWTLCRIHGLVNRQLLKIQSPVYSCRFDLQSWSLIIDDP